MASFEAARKRVLVVGCGYVAQHVVESLRGGPLDLTYSHRSEAPPFTVDGVASVRLDLGDDASCAEALVAARPDVIVNCAALASPAACEADEAAAMAANAPLGFLESLFACSPDALLVHLSTDLVLGSQAPGAEPYADGGVDAASARAAVDAAEPENAYGRTKLAFERALVDAWPRTVILRLSNVLGGPAPYTRATGFAQWVAAELGTKPSLELWTDEVRSFVDVRAVCAAVRSAADLYGVAREPADDAEREALERALYAPAETARFHERARARFPPVFLHLNLGGPSPLSRADLGREIARAIGYDPAKVGGVERPPRTTPAPLRVALDSATAAMVLRVASADAQGALKAAFEG